MKCAFLLQENSKELLESKYHKNVNNFEIDKKKASRVPLYLRHCQLYMEDEVFNIKRKSFSKFLSCLLHELKLIFAENSY